MNSINVVVIAGNLVRRPESRPAGGSTVATGTLALNRKYLSGGQTKEDVTFIDVIFWGATAEYMAKYGDKGRMVMVRGRLEVNSWTDKASGGKRSKVRVVAEDASLLGPRPEGKSDSQSDAPATGGGRLNPPEDPAHTDLGGPSDAEMDDN